MNRESMEREMMESISIDNVILWCLAASSENKVCHDSQFWTTRLGQDYGIDTDIEHDPRQLYYDLYYKRAKTFILKRSGQSQIVGYYYPKYDGIVFGIQRILPPKEQGILKFYDTDDKLLYRSNYPFSKHIPKLDAYPIQTVIFQTQIQAS